MLVAKANTSAMMQSIRRDDLNLLDVMGMI